MKYASCWQLITMSATDTGNITITGCCIELPTHFLENHFMGLNLVDVNHVSVKVS